MKKQKRADMADAAGGTGSTSNKKSKTDIVPVALSGSKVTTFKGYDLAKLGVPEEALPFESGDYKGQHSYTLLIQNAVAC